MNCDVCVVLVL